MTAADVRYPIPLARLNPWYPGQMGVPGTDTETGMRYHCTGTVFYVDPNYPGASDARDGTNPTDPMLTVQAALNRCQGYRGDVVVVMCNNNWIYDDTPSATIGYNTIVSEQVTMDVPGVSLVGINLSGTTGVPWSLPASDGTCITVNACNCTVEGFTFYGYPDVTGTAILATYIDAYGDNVTIRHNTFHASLEEGIILQHSWNTDIHHNWFLECAIGIQNDDAEAAADYNHVHHNYFFNCMTNAIYIGEASYWNVYENDIWNDDAAQGNAAANEMIQVTTGDFNLVHHNTMSCDPGPGNGDYNDCNTAGANDIWAQNYLMAGPTTANPL